MTKSTETLPDNHVRVSVRSKGHNLISRGDRPDSQNFDNHFEEGDTIVLPRAIARDLANRDLVDIAKD